MELLGTLQVMKGEDDEHYESQVFQVIMHEEAGDIRIETPYKGRIFMFRFQPDVLLAALARSMVDPEE